MARPLKTSKRKQRGTEVRKRLCARLALAFEASPFRHRQDLAERIGVHGASVSYWLQGRAWPGLDVIEELSTALGVTPAWFWGNDPPPAWDPPRPRQ